MAGYPVIDPAGIDVLNVDGTTTHYNLGDVVPLSKLISRRYSWLVERGILSETESGFSGGGAGTWGSITGTLSAQTDLQAALDAKLNLTGGTLTGDLTISKSSSLLLNLHTTTGYSVIDMRAPAGQPASIDIRTGSSYRWSFGKSAAAESGSDAGSNFYISSYKDGGSYTTPLTINRATDLVTLVGNLTVSGTGTSTFAGTLYSSSTTDSSSATTGAIQTAGGLGVAKQIYAGTNIISVGGRFDAINNANAKIRLGRANGATAPTTIATGMYLELGSAEWNTNSYRLISFGWRGSGSNPPSYIGYQEKDTNSFTKGDLIFGTRDVITDTEPTERLRIAASGLTTLTGNLIISKASPSLVISAPDTSSAYAYFNTTGAGNKGLLFQTSSTLRWGMAVNATAESGSNAGSDFAINRYNDAGSFVDSPLTIIRQTAWAYFSGNVNTAGVLSVTNTTDSSSSTTGSVKLSGGLGVNKKIFAATTIAAGGALVGQNASGYAVQYHDVASLNGGNLSPGAWVLTTPLPRDGAHMVKIRVHGFKYANSIIDFTVHFYTYSANGPDGVPGQIYTPILVDNGTDGLPKYAGAKDGYVVLAIGDTSSTIAYPKLNVDAFISHSAVGAYDTGWSWATTPNTTANFGWAYAPVNLTQYGQIVTLNSQTFPGIKTFSNTTDASSSTTGGVIISGGLGVAKKLYVGTNLSVAGTSTLTGAVTIGTATTAPALGAELGTGVGMTQTVTTVIGTKYYVTATTLTACTISPAGNAGETTLIVNNNTTAFVATATSHTLTGTGTGFLSVKSVTASTASATLVGSEVRGKDTVLGLGTYSLRYNFTNYTTAVGSEALGNNVTGYGNIATGYYALGGNVTGLYNTAQGYGAAQGVKAGSYNSAFGGNTLVSAALGTGNSVFGYYSGYYATGDYNTFIGYYSGASSTASNNTFVGVSSGRSFSSGAYNLALGANAGYTGTTGTVSGSVVVGTDSSGTGAQVTASNTIVLGTVNHTTVITGTTDSSSSTTGAVQIAGGVGIAKKLYVGTDLTVTGVANLSGSQHTIKNGTPSTLNFAKGSNWGYSSGYRVIILGDTAPANMTSISIGYDPSANTNGSFSGDGREILFRNAVEFTTPNSANTGWLKPLKFDSSGNSTVLGLTGTDTTDASSTTTGAFKTAGGLGVAKTLWAKNIEMYPTSTNSILNVRSSATYPVGISFWQAGVNEWVIGQKADQTFTFQTGGNFSGTDRLTITAGGIVNVPLSTDSSSSTTGALTVTGGIGVAKKAYFGDKITTTAVDVTTGDAAGNLLKVFGEGATSGMAITTNWNTGGAYLDFRLGGTTTTYNALRLNNGAIVQMPGTTDSSSTTTGTLQVAGGLGVVKKIYAGSDVNITGALLLGSSAGDRVMLYGAAGVASSYGFGIETATMYRKADQYHRWYVATNADAGVSDKMELSATTFTHNGTTANHTSTGTYTMNVIGAQYSTLKLTSGVGYTSGVVFNTAAAGAGQRWLIFKDESTESGSNVGSDFMIRNYSDAGSYISTPLTIKRSTGLFTLTGDMTMTKASPTVRLNASSGSPAFIMDAPSGAAPDAFIYLRTNGTGRWIFGKGGTESGSGNSGSNLYLYSYDDAGAGLGTPITITRATSAITIVGDLTMNKQNAVASFMSTGGGNASAILGAASGSSASVRFKTEAGVQRWVIGKNGSSETGTNAGSNFEIIALDDAGAVLSYPLSITRSTGLTTITSLTVSGALTATLTGNASTATTLQTARNINGVSFNGSADITVTAAAGTLTGTTLNATVVTSSLTSVGTISSGTWQGTVIGATYIDSAIARLASPTFTGVPLSTTAAVDTNTTQIATTAFVIGQGYLKSATASSTYAPLASPTFTGTVVLPAATSIGSVSSTEIGYVDGVTSAIQTQLNAKAPTASPSFTGTVTTPGVIRKLATKTTTYTLTSTDHIIVATTGSWYATLPDASGQAGREYVVKNTGTGTIIVDTTGMQNIDGALSISLEQYDSVTVVSNGLNWVII